MNKELALLIDVLWTGLLVSIAGLTFICGVMYAMEGAAVMATTGFALWLFFGFEGYKYVKKQGYIR